MSDHRGWIEHRDFAARVAGRTVKSIRVEGSGTLPESWHEAVAGGRTSSVTPDPLNAAVDRLCAPDVTNGATPCPPGLADALADLLLDCERVARETGRDMRGNPERVARAVLGWLR